MVDTRRMYLVPPRLMLLLFILVPLSTFAQAPAFPDPKLLEGKKAGDFVLNAGEYGRYKADWGLLLVPENRSKSGSRLTRLAIVRQRALKARDQDPLFTLVGGPGDSNVFGADYAPAFFQSNDLVRVGYRGIDGSVKLKCPEFSRALQTDNPLSSENIKPMRAALRSGFDRLTRKGIDLDGYNLVEVVDDMEAARKALGYPRINLLAVSWGTQIAYTYCLRYPGSVGRLFLVGAGGRGRGFDLWDPKLIEKKLGAYAVLWKKDAEAAGRTPDILATIRKVLGSLPIEWRGVRIDRDKVRLGLWYMLRESGGAAQAFDAFVAAEKGDYSGLAVLSRGYDLEIEKQLNTPHGEYHGEFFCKVMSSGLDAKRDYVRDMDPPGSILGSPAAKLLWGAASGGGWPVKSIPAEFCRNNPVQAEALVLMGGLDFASPHEYVEKELMPCLPRGRLIVLPNMGHLDVTRLQHEAFERLVTRFLREGVADASGYREHRIDFTPEETLGSHAREMFGSDDSAGP